MQKDYYEILRVFPSSSMDEIRRSYRRLAFRFHPDKNPGDPHSSDYFREITEAYDVLSNVSSRLEYDHQNGFRSRRHQAAITPQSLLTDASRLRRYVFAMNVASLDHEALQYHLNRILSDRNVELLQSWNHQALNRQIILELIDASRFLAFPLVQLPIQRMEALATNDDSVLSLISEYKKQRIQRQRWDKNLPYLVVLLTLLLCLMIYVASA